MTDEPKQHDEEVSYQPQRDPFTREDLNNAHQLRNTDFKNPLHNDIKNAIIYQSAKRGLDLIVDDFFSNNRFLTNLTSNKGGKDHVLGTNLDLERSMIFLTASLCPSDLKNPDYTNIRNGVLSHNRPITLRAVGADRERKLNNKTSISSEQTISRNDNITQQPPQQPKKKGWLSFLGET